jgi:hypothetical protein
MIRPDPNLVTAHYHLASTPGCASRVAKATCFLVMQDAAVTFPVSPLLEELLLLTNQQILPLRVLRPVLTSVDFT